MGTWHRGALARRSSATTRSPTSSTVKRSTGSDAVALHRTTRAHLLYGEWLRREAQRSDAREHLRNAHDMLAGIGMEAFAERARRELVTTVERARKRTADTRDDLTAQETQIARLARDGYSNPEIAAQLFLSPRTIEWHLRKVFTKLEINSRKELDAALLTKPRQPQPAYADGAGRSPDAAAQSLDERTGSEAQRPVRNDPRMDVPVQYFQSVIAIELAVAGALLWQIRFFESKSRPDVGPLPDARLRLGLALVLGITIFGSLWAMADEGPRWAALVVTVGLAVSVVPILLRVLPPLAKDAATNERDPNYAVTAFGLFFYVAVVAGFLVLLDAD
jgi:DNA-binding CsgD family transcriptional regulator